MDVTNWVALIAGIGFGTILSKLLDIFILHKRTVQSERVKWLRDNKLVAFTTLSQDLLSFGLSREDHSNPWEGYSNAAQAILLIEDPELVKRIDRFIVDLDCLHNLENSHNEAQETEASDHYSKLNQDARELIRDLRSNLLCSS